MVQFDVLRTQLESDQATTILTPGDPAEFEYRFNRRFDLDAMIERFSHAAVRTPPMPYRLLKLAEVYT